MACIKEYTIIPSLSPCLLNLSHGGNITALNLYGATVREINSDEDFHIQTLNGGAVVSAESNFDAGDIEALIAACHSGEAGATISEPCVFREILSGEGTWTLPEDAFSFSYYVQNVGDDLDPPQLVLESGTSDLIEEESSSFSSPSGPLNPNVSIETKAGDVIIVTVIAKCED